MRRHAARECGRKSGLEGHGMQRRIPLSLIVRPRYEVVSMRRRPMRYEQFCASADFVVRTFAGALTWERELKPGLLRRIV